MKIKICDLCGRLIDDDDENYKGLGLAKKIIGDMKPVEPERPKGEWEEYGHNLGDDYIPVGIRCSKCHIEPLKRDPSKDKSFMNYIKSDFCPSCGADMRGVN